MDNPILMPEQQQAIFAILSAVYGSEYPITLETIAYKTQQPVTMILANQLINLVMAGHLQEDICNGCISYRKPKRYRGPFPPLSLFHFD